MNRLLQMSYSRRSIGNLLLTWTKFCFYQRPRATNRRYVIKSYTHAHIFLPGTYNTGQKSLGHFQKIMNNYSFLSISTITPWCTPAFLLKQCWSVPETLGVIAHEKFFRYRMSFSQKPTLFRGRRGTNAPSRLKINKVSQDFWQAL